MASISTGQWNAGNAGRGAVKFHAHSSSSKSSGIGFARYNASRQKFVKNVHLLNFQLIKSITQGCH